MSLPPIPPLVVALVLLTGTAPAETYGARPVTPEAWSVAASGSWSWPVRGPVIRDFEPPESPFGSGHRGIDIAAAVGTSVIAPEAGTVAFAGRVGGELFVTLDHGGGLQSTYSWLSQVIVRRGDVVARGQPISATGVGHRGSSVPHLHFGVKLGETYLDPLDLLEPLGVQDLIRLVPLED